MFLKKSLTLLCWNYVSVDGPHVLVSRLLNIRGWTHAFQSKLENQLFCGCFQLTGQPEVASSALDTYGLEARL